MESVGISTLLSFAGGISVVGGAILTIQRVQKNIKKDKELERSRILHEAKEEDALMRIAIESKLDAIKSDLKNLESNINKDLEHIKQTHDNETNNLASKIEDLRDELRQQHGQLFTLISKLVEKLN